MAQAVRGQPVISQPWVRYRASRCGFCGGQTDTSTGFSLYTLVSPVSIIPPVLHTHVSVAGCTCCQQLAVSVHSYLKKEIMLSVLLFGQSKTSVIDIIDDDDDDDDYDGYLRT